MFQIREIVVQKIISDITQNGESKRIKLHEITKEKKNEKLEQNKAKINIF